MIHNCILKLFGLIRSFFNFVKIIFVFLIMVFLLYWTQNLTGSNWGWLSFISPFFGMLIKFSGKFFSASFDFWGAVFELRYFIILVILILLTCSMDWLRMLVSPIEDVYKKFHKLVCRAEEAALNKQLQADIMREEKRINTYMVLIHTSPKLKFAKLGIKINMEEQNRLMNKFMGEKTGVVFALLDGGFLYKFQNFEEIDNVLDVLFKIQNSDTPIEYAVCIQAGDNMQQLQKLAHLKHYGKITMASDTSFRYGANTVHKYQISQTGIFQSGGSTMEVHELMENPEYTQNE